MTDAHVRMSLELQRAFGLRREDGIKFRPSYADRDDHIVLKASWAKGGRERAIPIRNARQREVLDRAHCLAGAGSLIPLDRNYVHQLRVYEGYTCRACATPMRRNAMKNSPAGNAPPPADPTARP